MMAAMLHVGLTGNIASGKSQAALVFAELGAHIISADQIAHELLARGTTPYQRVVETFGPEVLEPDGAISRRKLGAIVFRDAEKRRLLNSIVHPEVRNQIWGRIAQLEDKISCGGIVIIDAALLIESGHYKLFHRLIVVTCDPQLQLARIIARDGLSIEDAKARMAAQMPVDEKLKVADYTIDTAGTFKETREQIEAIYRDLVLKEWRLREHPEPGQA